MSAPIWRVSAAVRCATARAGNSTRDRTRSTRKSSGGVELRRAEMRSGEHGRLRRRQSLPSPRRYDWIPPIFGGKSFVTVARSTRAAYCRWRFGRDRDRPSPRCAGSQTARRSRPRPGPHRRQMPRFQPKICWATPAHNAEPCERSKKLEKVPTTDARFGVGNARQRHDEERRVQQRHAERKDHGSDDQAGDRPHSRDHRKSARAEQQRRYPNESDRAGRAGAPKMRTRKDAHAVRSEHDAGTAQVELAARTARRTC